MEVVDDGDSAEVEQVLALAEIARPIALPGAEMRQAVLDRHPLAELRTPGRRRLPLPKLGQQAFVRVDADTAPTGTGRAALAQRAGGTGLGREVDGRAGPERQRLPVGAGQRARLPVQGEGELGEPAAVAHRPRLAVHREVVR